jgi:hypothetical protein
VARKQIGLALEPELLGRVDEARGDVPRARFIARALEAALGPVVVDDPDYFAEAPQVTAVEEASGGAQSPGDEADIPSGELVRPSRLANSASPPPSIDELREKGFVRPAATFSPKANVRPIPKDA